MLLSKRLALAAKKNLIKARSLIEKPERWAKGELFFDKKGNEMYFYAGESPKISLIGSMCALGAIQKADGVGEEAAKELLADAIYSLDHKKKRRRYINTAFKVYSFNDRKKTTHTDILDAFDRAIALAEAEANQ